MTTGEPWDELMGPSKDELSTMLRDPPAASPPVRSGSTGGAPPANMFRQEWGSEPSPEESALATQRAVSMASDDVALRESLTASASAISGRESTEEPNRIRQQALRMLEVADDRDSYSIHRTTTGGFQATASNSAAPKRMPAALSSLVMGSRFRDDPYAVDELAAPSTSKSREAYEYGDDSVVDVVGMEQRFGATSEKKKSWSSRYSVDRTLMALAGGSTKQATLDKMDKDNERERLSARNMFGQDRSKVFGSGFSFRSSNVFGKQGATLRSQNLKTEWMDTSEREATLGSATPAKSWQEQLARKRQMRRRIVLGSLLFLVFIVTMGSVFATRSSEEAPHKAVTFFISSTMPLNVHEQHRMDDDLKDPILKEGAFFVHLGNLQIPTVTNCRHELYEDVADRMSVSVIPAFVLPGKDDWNDCPHPDTALAHWRDNFLFYDTQWKYGYNVERQAGHEENFAMQIDGVAFIGVFEVPGRVPDWDEFQDRHEANVSWIKSRVASFSGARSIVVMANTRPGLRQNDLFFDELTEFLEQTGKPSLYVHAHSDDHDDLAYVPFETYSLKAVQAPHGGESFPLRVSVGFGEDPFIVG